MEILELTNARKIYTLEKKLAVTVLGLPKKITDIYDYINVD